ncbi:hypothetical protein HHL19_17555 [Streptomyces sp. R302]|uniref:hypothetical protein n=1 Tax=unclassified Streptomyces TaxID=2593676 RepID=UPI00145D69F4|nr:MULTISPECIES: hypothetical protein [unclassified Streptomyces]NML52632.1 hypothetical protein [Streptomyces sp. R301]NML80439.1 hypothetical protein [Streptomyces sp. R302]
MALPPDESVLDALDAYLEARWDGAAAQAPELPEHRPEEGTLVGWVRERLRELPAGPTRDSALQAGTLLREFRSRRSAWNAAALRLLDDTYTFVATGPRRHDDWAHDVRAVMHRSVRDPRGWIRLDGDRTGDVRDTLPAYPFDPPAASDFPARLRPVDADEAAGALAVMAEEWQAEPAPVRTRPDRDALLADARTLLDRYGPDARYWTNATTAQAGSDFVAAGLAGTRSHPFVTGAYVGGLDLLEDLGLIAVSADEVGVFWSIGAY